MKITSPETYLEYIFDLYFTFGSYEMRDKGSASEYMSKEDWPLQSLDDAYKAAKIIHDALKMGHFKMDPYEIIWFGDYVIDRVQHLLKDDAIYEAYVERITEILKEGSEGEELTEDEEELLVYLTEC